MKKKILASFLVVIMLISTVLFTGCAEDKTGAITEEAERSTLTLSLWMPTDSETTSEAIKQVQDAINKITTAKYQTAIEFNAIPTDEYEARLQAHMEKVAKEVAEQKNNKKNNKTESNAADDMYEISNGVTSVLYPKVKSTQMDIFLIRSYEDYIKYIDAGEVVDLDADINGDSKLLKEYIYPTFLEYAAIYDGATYAIPNNHQIGDYKFLLVNKRLVSELYYDINTLNSLNRCKDFIIDVANSTDVTPILSPVAASAGTVYLSLDGSRNVLGYVEVDGCSNATFATITNVLRIPDYTDNIYNMKMYAENGYFAEDPENCTEFGVGVIEGGYEVYEQYGDEYYVKVYERPIAHNEDIFSGMFAVSQYSADVARAMEIITMVNTNPELRTVLQYGAQGIHWDFADDEETMIKQLSDDYKMNLLETGNVYMTYPDYGQTKEVWELAKKSNLESSTSPFLCVTGYVNDESLPYYDALATLSESIFARIDAMTSEEFKAELSSLRSEVNKNEAYKWMTTSDDDNIKSSIAYVYLDYFMLTYPDSGIFG